MDIKTRLKKLEQTMTEQKTTKEWKEACTCFPPDELPAFHWLAEVKTAGAIHCPLHGVRFHAIETPPVIYRSKWLRRADHTTLNSSHYSPEYSKAWRVGFPPDLWPARLSFQYQSGSTETLIPRDGTEIASGGSAKKWQPANLGAGR